MGSLNIVPMDDDKDVNEAQQKALELLSTLIRAHYLEKSEHFHQAMDFEKLFRLDRLTELHRLDELKQLHELDQLKALGSLKDLEKLTDLNNLTELRPLVHLERLQELNHLSKLDRLTHLNDLDRLVELKQLDNLDHLKELEKLSIIEKLNEALFNHKETLAPLQKLDQLESLKKLNDLEKLGWLIQLDKLTQLDHLDKLDQLTRLNELTHLDKLGQLKEMQHLDRLDDLKHLAGLSKLDGLERLDNLQNLDQLQELNKLDKLDKINDAKFSERLNKLDKLDILQQNTGKLIFQQVIGLFLDFFKVLVIASGLIFYVTSETGREAVIKTLPLLGYGQAAQVNLGLKLLVGEVSPTYFLDILKDVRSRSQAEIELVFNPSAFFPIQRRMELLGQVMSYSFKGVGVDIQEETKNLLEKELKKTSDNAIARLEFEMAQAKSNADTTGEDYLREIKVLLTQKQYPQLVEKVLPQWNTSEAKTLAGIVGTTSLKMRDPETLNTLLRQHLSQIKVRP